MKSLSFLKDDRNLQVICLINFVGSIGQACTIPIMPIYVRSFGVSYSVVGLVIASAGITRLFTDIPVGFVLDRLGRKPMLRLAMFLLGSSTLLPIFEGGVAPLIIFQVIQGAGMGILMIVVLTVVGDISPQNKKGSYVGYLFASDSLGIAIGSSASGKLVQIGDFQAPFVGMLVFSAIAALLVELRFHESLPSSKVRPPIKGGLRINMPSRNVMVGFVAAATVSILNVGTGNTAIPLYEASILISPFQIGLALTTVFLASFIVQPWAGGICDKVGTKRVFVLGFMLSAISSLLFVFSKQFYILTVIAMLFGFSIGIVSSANAAIVIESSGQSSRGFSMALYRVFRDLGSVLGPVMVGASSDLVGIPFAFTFSAVICFTTAVLGYVLRTMRITQASN